MAECIIIKTNKTPAENKPKFGKITVKTAGTTFDGRQGKLFNVRNFISKNQKITVMLRREPNNEHDPHAIAVLVQTGNTVAKVGYVPADKAFWLSTKMDNQMIVRAYGGTVTGGSGYAKTLGFTFEIVHQLYEKAVAVAPEK